MEIIAFLSVSSSSTNAQIIPAANITINEGLSSRETRGAATVDEETFRLSRLELEENLGIGNMEYDSSKVVPTIETSDTSVDTNAVLIKQKSALTAVLLSAVIPGGGQVYNGSYWKVPIIIGVQAFFISEWISNNKTYQSLQTQYADSVRAAGPSLSWTYQEMNYLSGLQSDRDAVHDQRDSYAWYIAGVYLLSMLDAYVDAELSGFDVSPSLGVNPAGSATFAISCRIRF